MANPPINRLANQIAAATQAANLAPPVNLLALNPGVSFTFHGVQPPSNLYITPDDRLTVFGWTYEATFTVLINGRILRPDGVIVPFADAFSVSTSPFPGSVTLPLTEGYLVSLVILATSGLGQPGILFTQACITRGAGANLVQVAVLAQDYITSATGIAYPPGRIRSALEGDGFANSLAGTAPGVGSESTFTVTTNALFKVRAVHATLTTDAVVGNRQAAFQFRMPGATYVYQAASIATQAASLTYDYFCGAEIGYKGSSQQKNAVELSIPRLRLPAGSTIQTKTSSLDAGDQWSAITVDADSFVQV